MIAIALLLALQEDLTVLKPDENGKTALYEFLRAECGKHFDARRKEVAGLKSADDAKARAGRLRARFLEALGELPERTPLNAKSTGTVERNGIRAEKLVFESRPGHHVTAVLYLPAGKGPFPGVLVPCGHSDNGKAAEAYQRACLLMAKNGCAVLCYDPIGQGERRQRLDAAGKPAVRGSTDEHTFAGIGALLVGRSCAGYRVWDGMRALDYLAGRPEVDPTKLGCAGNSGGGTLTSYLMALDDRIAAAAPSCYLTTLERLFETIGPQDAEQNVTGQVAFGMEHADYVTMRAPKPTLINVGTQDYFDIQGAKTTFREAKSVYGLHGAADRVELFEFDDKHGWSKPRRESAARWMRRWLLGESVEVREPEMEVFTDAELQATASGQVLTEFGGKSVFDLNLERAEALAKARPKLRGDALRDAVRRRLALEVPERDAKATSRGSSARDGYDVSKRVLGGPGGPKVPMLVFTPRPAGDRVVIYLDPAGKAAGAAAGGPIEKLVRAGNVVVAPDLPGWGETALHPGGKPFGPDWKESALSLHLDRPLLGRRVGELLALIRTIDAKEIRLVGLGAAAPVVLHAAFLDPRVAGVDAVGGPASWSELLRNPLTPDAYSSVVPGALSDYDLPDLIR